ncbi:hypothetical protein EBL87_17505 [Cereibacter sphaeroides]|uniref:hypothetical protein n=1 Tax=Cereibacter sphaeroides TaxID=1063 RepID=UPI000F543092|nr:hypothetical protein [Cereibacter sphaeroides]AZB65537.1 hypothetical protein EBL87_17505 [Cereibacter sphaeroides]AZB70289.1 hypothetical protein EBL86_18015 [Cereibacter sphaeroides]
MPIPARPPAPPPALRSNPETFSANAEATILYQWGAFPAWLERIARYTEAQAEAALTAALGGALPPLAGKAGQFLRVKEDGSAPELVARPAGDQLEAAGTGIMVKTSGGVVARSLTSGGNNGIQILYGSGSAGDPTINGITRTQAQWRDPSDTTEAVLSPAKLAAYRDARMLGWGQAWPDTAASRSSGTVYQNTTGRPIALFVRTSSGSPQALQVSLNGVSGWVKIGEALNSGSDKREAFGIMPADHFYRLTSGGIEEWTELR